MSSSIKILLIEDEAELRDAVRENLALQSMRVVGFETGENIVHKLDENQPDLVVLDQVLPGKSGQEILVEIRANSKYCNIPILILTGLTAEAQLLEAFDAGADDYMTKPFSPKELAARCLALIRRAQSLHQDQVTVLSHKDLHVDLKTHRVTVKSSDVPLTLTEFKILCELLRQSGQVLTRDRLREKALGNLNVSDRTIDVHMASLRKKIDGMGSEIETVRGVGYRLAH